jgi:hypothetical protein
MGNNYFYLLIIILLVNSCRNEKDNKQTINETKQDKNGIKNYKQCEEAA